MVKKLKHGAIVLAGGQSRRMGQSKAELLFGNETLLSRVLNVVAPLTDCQIVVTAEDQQLPRLAHPVIRTTDQHACRGPLEGLRSGLEAGTGMADVFYVSSCDVPLLQPGFVEFMFDALTEDDQIAVPRDDQHYHPLAAVYRHSVLATVEQLLRANRLRPFYLFAEVNTRTIPTNSLRSVDPQLLSLRNLNTPAEYAAALQDAGIDPPGGEA